MKNKKNQYRVPGEALIMYNAGLDRSLVKELRNNVPRGECNLVKYVHAYKSSSMLIIEAILHLILYIYFPVVHV